MKKAKMIVILLACCVATGCAAMNSGTGMVYVVGEPQAPVDSPALDLRVLLYNESPWVLKVEIDEFQDIVLFPGKEVSLLAKHMGQYRGQVTAFRDAIWTAKGNSKNIAFGERIESRSFNFRLDGSFRNYRGKACGAYQVFNGFRHREQQRQYGGAQGNLFNLGPLGFRLY